MSDPTAAAVTRAISHLLDQQAAAEKAGQGRVTVGTGDLKLLLRMYATLFRRDAAAAYAARMAARQGGTAHGR